MGTMRLNATTHLHAPRHFEASRSIPNACLSKRGLVIASQAGQAPLSCDPSHTPPHTRKKSRGLRMIGTARAQGSHSPALNHAQPMRRKTQIHGGRGV
jgi:hypothetical protein